jgi:hypothetical protein
MERFRHSTVWWKFFFNKSPQRLLVDTGAGVITYPRGLFDQFRNYILSLGIPSLKFYDKKGNRFFAFESEYGSTGNCGIIGDESIW